MGQGLAFESRGKKTPGVNCEFSAGPKGIRMQVIKIDQLEPAVLRAVLQADERRPVSHLAEEALWLRVERNGPKRPEVRQ